MVLHVILGMVRIHVFLAPIVRKDMILEDPVLLGMMGSIIMHTIIHIIMTAITIIMFHHIMPHIMPHTTIITIITI